MFQQSKRSLKEDKFFAKSNANLLEPQMAFHLGGFLVRKTPSYKPAQFIN